MAPAAKDIVIAGAGLGGLAAALRLSQDGHNVRVFERKSALSNTMGWLLCRPNATRCFYRWNMQKALEAATSKVSSHMMRNGYTSQLLWEESASIYSEFPEVATFRSAIQKALYDEAIVAGATITFDAEVSDLWEDDGKAYLTLKDGTKHAADLVLVADGISSRLRSKVIQKQVSPIAEPTVMCPAEIPLEKFFHESTRFLTEAPESDKSQMWPGAGGSVIGKYHEHKRLYTALFTMKLSEEEASETLKLYDEHGDTTVIREFFKDYCPAIRILSEATENCSRWRLARLEPLDRWSSKGRRLVLLGDSAHAMLPFLAEGFSSIIEDVDALSIVLSEGKGDLPELVRLWEELRIPRANRIQAGSLWNFSLYLNEKAPGMELTQEERALPPGEGGDGKAKFNTKPFWKWLYDYDTAKETRAHLANAGF